MAPTNRELSVEVWFSGREKCFIGIRSLTRSTYVLFKKLSIQIVRRFEFQDKSDIVDYFRD